MRYPQSDRGRRARDGGSLSPRTRTGELWLKSGHGIEDWTQITEATAKELDRMNRSHELIAEGIEISNALITDLERHHPKQTFYIEEVRKLVTILDGLAPALGRKQYSVVTLASPDLVAPCTKLRIEVMPQIRCRLYAVSIALESADFQIHDFGAGHRSYLLTPDPIAAEALLPVVRGGKLPPEPHGANPVSIVGIDPERPLESVLFTQRTIIETGHALWARVENISLTPARFRLNAFVEVL